MLEEVKVCSRADEISASNNNVIYRAADNGQPEVRGRPRARVWILVPSLLELERYVRHIC